MLFNSSASKIKIVLAVYLHLQDKELKDILEANDEKALIGFINNILSGKL